MSWRNILERMGFVLVEGESYIYKNKNLGEFEFDFSNRQSVDAIVAEIWDVAQRYGEKKARNEVIKNIFG